MAYVGWAILHGFPRRDFSPTRPEGAPTVGYRFPAWASVRGFPSALTSFLVNGMVRDPTPANGLLRLIDHAGKRRALCD